MEHSDAFCRLVDQLGRPRFFDELARLCLDVTGADQVTAFFGQSGQIRCAFQLRPGAPKLLEAVVHRYLGQFSTTDALFEPGPDVETRVVHAADIADAAYRERLFTQVGLAGKVAVIARNPARTMAINFYFATRRAPRLAAAERALDGAGRLILALAQKHLALSGSSEQPGPSRARAYLAERFPTLSPREADVLGGLLAGQSQEAIALSLGLGRETVVTHRKRGYQKLGISTRGELFAACAALLQSVECVAPPPRAG